MDQFHDRKHVQLRSRVLGTYVHADHDGERVSLSRRRDSLNTAWVAHIHQRADGLYLLLHSAAYGRYLGTTFKPAPLGHHGCRTEQRDYDDEPDLMAVMWKAAGAGFGDVVLLRNVSVRVLRANGRDLPWNGVTVDDNVSSMMYWTVEPIPARGGPPGLPGPIQLGHHGCCTEQRDYDDELDLMAVMWKAAGAGFDDVVLLRNAAGRCLSWNTGVTVDNIGNISAMMY
ncbi:uncharacterized protein LOC119333150 [Triticum dicoccoides]|uniref:uncharacterized protein LOC119333150 n=1 Tax=Triticum dicoccoides TaxID=85692 RepID=UPI001891DAC7|nr:uncharacterized protein LOC119333150 [Triticum dicoccoides]